MMPAEAFAHALDFVHAQRCAVGVVGAGLGRRAITDGGFTRDQRWLVRCLGFFDGGFDSGGIVTVDRLCIPVGRFKARALVIAQRQVGIAINTNFVVIPHHDQLAQLQMAGHGNGLLGNAFHQAAITGNGVGVVIDKVVAVTRVHHLFSHRHADRGGDALAQRAGGGFHAVNVAIFGVACGFGTHLAKVLDVINRHIVNA